MTGSKVRYWGRGRDWGRKRVGRPAGHRAGLSMEPSKMRDMSTVDVQVEMEGTARRPMCFGGCSDEEV